MMAVETTPRAQSLTLPRLAGLLAIIAVLAFVLPYGAVQTLHNRRLRAADEATRAIAERLKALMAGDPVAIPAGTEVLAGPGDRPAVPPGQDERWNSATSIPLERVTGGAIELRPDPWRNAYLVSLGAGRSGGTVWVLSAGPDGIVQTPFLAPNGPVADDRAAPVR